MAVRAFDQYTILMQYPQKTTANTPQNTYRALLIIIMGAVVSGAMTTMIKIGLSDIPLYTFSFLRMAIALIVTIPFYLRQKVVYDKKFARLFGFAVLPFFNILFFSIGITETTASIGQTLYAAVPLITAILLMVFFKKSVPILKLFFIITGFIGTITIILLPLLQQSSAYSGTIGGNGLIFIAVLCWSIYTILSENYQKHYSPIIINAVFSLFAMVMFFILAIPELLSFNEVMQSLNGMSVMALLYVGIFGTFGGYLIHQYAIKYGGPLVASLGFYLLPITAYISSYFFLGERLTMGLIIGFIIIIVSVFMETYVSK